MVEIGEHELEMILAGSATLFPYPIAQSAVEETVVRMLRIPASILI